MRICIIFFFLLYFSNIEFCRFSLGSKSTGLNVWSITHWMSSCWSLQYLSVLGLCKTVFAKKSSFLNILFWLIIDLLLWLANHDKFPISFWNLFQFLQSGRLNVSLNKPMSYRIFIFRLKEQVVFLHLLKFYFLTLTQYNNAIRPILTYPSIRWF
jgi:hypothetical protein